MKLLRKLLTALIVLSMAGAGALFALQNKTLVPLDALIYTFQPQSLALWVLVAFASGGVLGMLVSSVILLRMRASLSSSKRQLERSRGEADALRSTGDTAEAS